MSDSKKRKVDELLTQEVEWECCICQDNVTHIGSNVTHDCNHAICVPCYKKMVGNSVSMSIKGTNLVFTGGATTTKCPMCRDEQMCQVERPSPLSYAYADWKHQPIIGPSCAVCGLELTETHWKECTGTIKCNSVGCCQNELTYKQALVHFSVRHLLRTRFPLDDFKKMVKLVETLKDVDWEA